MTDERIGNRLWEAIDRLPSGRAGIIFRHYSLRDDERASLGQRVAELAAERELVFAVGGSSGLAKQLGAALIHKPDGRAGLPISLPVHDEAEARNANELGAALAFISPIHATRSHASAPLLGADGAARLARRLRCPAIALGGMSAARFGALEHSCPGLFYGFAGIDCWLSG